MIKTRFSINKIIYHIFIYLLTSNFPCPHFHNKLVSPLSSQIRNFPCPPTSFSNLIHNPASLHRMRAGLPSREHPANTIRHLFFTPYSYSLQQVDGTYSRKDRQSIMNREHGLGVILGRVEIWMGQTNFGGRTKTDGELSVSGSSEHS